MIKKDVKFWIGFSAAILLGLIMLAAGIGKSLTPDFSGVVVVNTFLPEFWAKVVAVTVPIAESVLGLLLITGLWVKPAATLSLPMSLAFAINNAWLISLGLVCPTCPHCFGKWEELFGVMTTWQAFYTDIFMIVLAVVVLVLLRYPWFKFRFWFSKETPTASA